MDGEHPTLDGLARPLTWAQVETMFPGCSPAFDRDVGDVWTPVLRLRRDRPMQANAWVLWADDADCVNRVSKMGPRGCRCVYYDSDAENWNPRIDVHRRGVSREQLERLIMHDRWRR